MLHSEMLGEDYRDTDLKVRMQAIAETMGMDVTKQRGECGEREPCVRFGTLGWDNVKHELLRARVGTGAGSERAGLGIKGINKTQK